MFKFKKTIAVILAFASVAALASCGSDDTKSADGSSKVTMLFMEGGSTPFKSDWEVLKRIKEKTGVEIDAQVVPGKDFATKKSTLFASGDIPDIIVNMWPSETSQYAKEGLVLPVSDYVDKMPNFKEILETWDLDATIKDISEMDGKFYILPLMTKELGNTNCFGVREDIFNKHNIPLPTTYDELRQALKQLKQLYPESLGTGDLYNGAMIMSFVAESFGTNGGFSLPYGYSYNYDTEEWYYAPTSEQYKTLLEYLNGLYNDGGLDIEGFTQDSNQYSQKVLNSQYFVIPINGPQDAKSNTKNLQDNGVPDAKFTALYPLAGPTGLRKVKPASKNQGGLTLASTLKDRDDFDKILDFCDWLYYSEEAAIMSTIGFEGITYDMVDGNPVMKPDVRTANNLEGTVNMANDYGIGQWGLQSLVTDRVPDNIKKVVQDPDQLDFNQYLVDHDMKTPDDPILKFTDEQAEEVNLLTSTLNDYTDTMIMKFIYGQESLDNWDAYVNEVKSKGSDRLMEIVNQAWVENNKKNQ